MKRSGIGAKIAYPAVLAALSVALCYVGSIAPSGNWGIVAVAGLFPVAAVISVSLKAGFLCWAGASVLNFLLLPSKFCALLFTVLFGLYPVLKGVVERLRKKPLEYLLKLVFFNGAFALIYLTMQAAVLNSLPKALGSAWLLYLVANVVFLIYDFGLTKLIGFYIVRIHRAVR